MKRIPIILFVLALVVSACAPKTSEAPSVTLTVSMGELEKTYTPTDLQALGETQAAFNDVTYIGVRLTDLLADAGIDAASLAAIKVIATDGYTVNYDPSLFNLPDTLVAYARLDGPLTDTEAPFTMVLPGQEGKLNARMVVSIVALP